MRTVRTLLQQLQTQGWQIDYFAARHPLPRDLVKRYPWIPSDFRQFAEEVRGACSPDDTVWFLTALDFAMESDTAFAWNAWEQLSLEAAENDEDWKAKITAFWNDHLPVLLSVKSGYEYFAVTRSGAVIRGVEPEFEETAVVAASFTELLKMVVARDPELFMLF